MIKKLTLKNFRKHRDLSLDFQAGLNVLRGANEQGKSTIIEGVLYPLYGTKALRTTLAEAVTWGEKESSLKSTLVLTIGGIDYTFTRSKSGAEVNWNGIYKVTGQTEVSAFAAELLGADARMAAMLMLSSQSGLRGALDDGPAAVSGLMGKLANFDLVDRIIDAAQSYLVLGSDVPLRERLEQSEAELQALPVADPEEWKGHELRREEFQKALAASEGRLATEVEPAWKKALDALNAAVAANTQYRDLNLQRADSVRHLEGTEIQLAKAEGKAKRVPNDQLLVAQQAVEAFRNRLKLLEVRQAVRKLGAFPETFWEGPFSEFFAELTDTQQKVLASDNRIMDLNRDIKALMGQLIKEGGKCPTCGHEAPSDEHVTEHNANIRAQVDELYKQIELQTSAGNKFKSTLRTLVELQKTAKPWVDAATRYEDYTHVTVDESSYPPRVTWTGGDLSNDGADAESELKRLRDLDNAALRAEGEAQAHRTTIADLQKKIAEFEAKLAKATQYDEAPLRQAHDDAFAESNKLRAEINDLGLKLDQARSARDLAKQSYEAAVRQQVLLRERIADLKLDIERVSFNNGLLKKLRAIKPMVTDHLWNTVLSAVSNFFSTLRGEYSVVTKDAGGFKVNGQNVESLSGSTLDVLALAIRVALTKTFIPHASFLVLDEPAHGCDNIRTGNVLGFLSSVGFQQTLVASHDELSEAVADCVVTLGD